MASGRIRRSARRGVAAAVLGWLAVAAVSVLMAPSASAAPTATVEIRDLTPPVVSVDAGGSVTFVNLIQDKTVQVGGGGLVPSLVNVTARTEVTLGLPSGSKALAPGASVTERFDSTCATCTITYTYRLSSGSSLTQAVTNAALAALPPLPAPTPFVVNTILPDVPNLPSVNVPQLPTVTVPLPGAPEVVDPNNPTVPGPTDPNDPGGPTPGGPTPEGIPGSQYNYDLDGGAPDLTPVNAAAAAAFDPSRYFVPGESLGGVDGGSGEGAGGQTGNYDGAAVPVFGQLAGLDGAALDEEAAAQAEAAGGSTPALPAAALAAVVALAAVTAALVRTHQAQRESR
jgi:hypothetical protein